MREILQKRERDCNPVQVAVVGAGWFAKGLIKELVRWPGITPKIVITRRVHRAIAAYRSAGIKKAQLVVVNSIDDLRRHLSTPKYLVTDQIDLIGELKSIDAVYEATGDVFAGAKTAELALNNGMHFITVSSELDSTVGHILYRLAKAKGLVYSNSDGDQPGVLARMIADIRLMGFGITVAGNCKGYLDPYKTPDDIMPWVRPGHNPKMVASFTDGTKQSVELAVTANAIGLLPDKRGMHGCRTTKATLVQDFLKVITQEGVVDYCMGIDGVDQGAGVFVIAKRTEDSVIRDMEYLKKGKGPYYLFFKDHHLCYFEAPRSIVEAVLFRMPTLVPKYYYADVMTIAKCDLKRGEKLDGSGGYTVYGVTEKAKIVQEDCLLPVGLSEYAVLTRDVEKDTPITYEMVEFTKDNLVLELRRKQEQLLVQKAAVGMVNRKV